METFLYKRTLAIYWFVLFLHCFFQYLQLPFLVVTKSMLVPLLFLYVLLHDSNIGSTAGKLLFYIGLILAFLGDLLFILINDTFFLGGMIAFMLMNLFYSSSFLFIRKLSLRGMLPVLLSLAFMAFISNAFYRFLGKEMGNYQYPIFVYIITLSIMLSFAVNAAGSIQHRRAVVSYLVPGVFIFLVENVLVAVNKFHYDRNKDIVAVSMFTYGLAQYLIVKGMRKIYP